MSFFVNDIHYAVIFLPLLSYWGGSYINSLFLSLLLFWSLAILFRLEDSKPSPGVLDKPGWMNWCLPLEVLQYLTVEGRSVEAPGSRESFVLGGMTKPRMQASSPHLLAQPISALVTCFELHPFTHSASIHWASGEPTRHCPCPHETCSSSGKGKVNTVSKKWMNKRINHFLRLPPFLVWMLTCTSPPLRGNGVQIMQNIS